MDLSQCVTWLLWMQVNVFSGSYGRKSMCYLLVMAACHASSVSYGHKSMRYTIVMVASKGVTWKLWTRVNALHALVVMDASCYGRKSTCYLVVMDARQCVPCWLWMQVKASPRSYRRKSMCHMVVWTQVNASHGSCGRKSMCYLLVMDASQSVTW